MANVFICLGSRAASVAWVVVGGPYIYWNSKVNKRATSYQVSLLYLGSLFFIFSPSNFNQSYFAYNIILPQTLCIHTVVQFRFFFSKGSTVLGVRKGTHLCVPKTCRQINYLYGGADFVFKSERAWQTHWPWAGGFSSASSWKGESMVWSGWGLYVPP